MALLDDEGMTSVVATNCEQTYERPLVVGDRLLVTSVVEAVSEVKETGLGTGRFVTTRSDFVAVADSAVEDGADPAELAAGAEPVATMRFRILKFRPSRADSGRPGGGRPGRPKRPRPAITEDIAFWFEGTRRARAADPALRRCGQLRHPPLPACPACRSFAWDTVRGLGQGHRLQLRGDPLPPGPGLRLPPVIGLVELEEGTRLVADLGGIDPGEWQVGMAVEAEFVDHDDELTLPVFHPADRGRWRLMDFSFTDEQLAVRQAAEGVFGGLVDPERVAEVEATEERFDRALWAALAEADLLGLAVPTEHGGGGLGLTELCLVLEAQGPAWRRCPCGPPPCSGRCPWPASPRRPWPPAGSPAWCAARSSSPPR